MRKVDKTEKNPIKELTDNDGSDTGDDMNELVDLPKNRKMPSARNVQQKKRSSIEKQKKTIHTSNRALNQMSDNGLQEGHNKVHKRKNNKDVFIFGRYMSQIERLVPYIFKLHVSNISWISNAYSN